MNTTIYKMSCNYHTHTKRCKHAIGSEEDYVLEAIKKNLTEIAISDHAPFPDNRFNFSRMDYSELDDYLSEIDRLNSTYNINVLKSLEIEFFEDQIPYYRYLLEEKHLDYLLLGQHYFYCDNEYVSSFSFDNTKDSLNYARTIQKALDTKLFKILAHPDVFMASGFTCDNYIDEAMDIIIAAAIKNDVYLEFNANGVRKGFIEVNNELRYPYPSSAFWQKVAKTRAKIIINSDCHEPRYLVDQAVKDAYEYAKKLNLKVESKIY